MNKNDIINAVAESSNLSKAEAARSVQEIFDSIASALGSGGSVAIAGFGTFSVSHRPARTGRNPQTGETIQIAASMVPKFKAGKSLKESVNRAF